MAISDDIIKASVELESNQALAELTKLESATFDLRKENERLAVTKAKLKSLGKEESEEYKKITATMQANSKVMKENQSAMASHRRTIGLTAMSMKDLRKRAHELQSQLDNTSRSANPKGYASMEKELGKVRKQMNSLHTGTSKTGQMLRGFGALLPISGVAALAAGISKMAVGLFNLSKRMQAEDRKAMIVLGDSMGYVEEQAGKLAKKIGVTRHEFTGMVTNTTDLLVPLDFSRKKAAEMAVQVQSLAGAMDEWTGGSMGVAAASETLNTAMLGEMERLKQYGIAIRQDSEEFKNLVKAKKADGAATDEQAKALATLELIMKKSKDAQTSFAGEGNKLMRWQKEITRGWRQLKENVVGYFETNPAEKIRQEKDAVNLLVMEYTDANTPLERRKEILEKLNQLAPDIVTSLDSEGKATRTTTDALRDYNRTMVERIMLAEKQLEYEDKVKKQARIAGQREETEKKLNQMVVDRVNSIQEEQKQKEYLGVLLNGELSLLQKIEALRKSGLDLNVTSTFVAQGQDPTARIDLFQEQINAYKRLMEAEREQKWTANDIFNDIKDKQAELGMLMSGPWAPGYDSDAGSGGGGKKTDDEQKKAYQKDLEATKDYITAKQNLLKESYVQGRITQDEYVGELMTLEFDSLQARLNLSKKFNIDVAESGRDLLDQHIKIKEQQAEMVDQITKDLVKSLEESEKDASSAFSKLLSEDLEDYFKNAKPFEPSWDEKNNLAAWEATYEGQVALLDNKLSMEQISETAHREAIDQLDKEYQQKKYERLIAYGETAKGVLDAVTMFQEAAMNRELAAAGKNTKKREEIEKKYNEKKRKWAIAQTIIEGILEIAGIWKSSASMGPAGIALAIAQTAAAVLRTGAQIAVLSSQKFDRGGYTPPGAWDRPQGVVHSEEFVANRYAVRNPDVRRILDVIDSAQRSGRIGTLNTDTILRAVEARRGGMAAGGYTPASPQSPEAVVVADPELRAIIAENARVTEALRQQLAKGFRGWVVYNDIEEAAREVNGIRSATTIS